MDVLLAGIAASAEHEGWALLVGVLLAGIAASAG